jgi:hypothetical protein
MGHRRHRRVVLAAALGLALGGCSVAGSGQPAAETITGGTPHGLTYTLRITAAGSQRCTTATYRSALPDGRPVIQGSRTCANAAALPGHPLLVQARASSQSLLVDVTPDGCGTVRGGSTYASVRPLVSRCGTGRPAYRVTVLPAIRRLALVGVPGAPVINFPRHRCLMSLCLTPLA